MPNYNADRFAAFSAAYLAGLTEAVKANPGDYTPNMVASLVAEIEAKMAAETIAKMERCCPEDPCFVDGKGFKNACKALGIKHTRKAITAFLKGE